jgi:hypothetical protein
VTEGGRQRFDEWRLPDLLSKYSELTLRPTNTSQVTLSGTLAFSAERQGGQHIDDQYDITICIPEGYPRQIPRVWETKKRIPSKFHKLIDGSLCLGSETRLRLILAQTPSMLSFVERCVVPYLYGHSFYEQYGKMPFGELSHGPEGVIEDLASLFATDKDRATIKGFVTVAALKKGVANKLLCPCGSGFRLGRCHRKRVNSLRKQLGRRWFGSLKLQLQ